MKKFILPAKIVVSVSLIGYLLYAIDWVQALRHLSQLNWYFIVLMYVLLTSQFPIRTFKWNIALQSHELYFDFIFLLKVLSIGFFFNNFLPTAIGGDAYRVLKTIPPDGLHKSRALSAVLLDRIFGYAALMSLGFIGSLYLMATQTFKAPIYYALVFACGLLGLGLFLLLMRTSHYQKAIAYLKKIKKLDILFRNLEFIRKHKGRLLGLFTASLIFQITSILIMVVLFHAIGIHGVLAQCAFLAAIVGVVSVLPISINGIGVIEGSFVVAAALVGIGFTEATFVAIAQRLLTIPMNVACGMVYAFGAEKPVKAEKSG